MVDNRKKKNGIIFKILAFILHNYALRKTMVMALVEVGLESRFFGRPTIKHWFSFEQKIILKQL
jgi:hypothetical protein